MKQIYIASEIYIIFYFKVYQLVNYGFGKEDGKLRGKLSSPWLDAFRTQAFEVTDDVRKSFIRLWDDLNIMGINKRR